MCRYGEAVNVNYDGVFPNQSSDPSRQNSGVHGVIRQSLCQNGYKVLPLLALTAGCAEACN